MSEVRTGFFPASGGVNLYYEDTGSGEPIVFVHEFAGVDFIPCFGGLVLQPAKDSGVEVTISHIAQLCGGAGGGRVYDSGIGQVTIPAAVENCVIRQFRGDKQRRCHTIDQQRVHFCLL